MLKKLPTWQIKGFTLLESLVTLVVVSLITLTLSGTIQTTFATVKEHLFWLSFEQLYRDTQKMSLVSQTPMTLQVGETISNGVTQLEVPKTVQVLEARQIMFDRAGGNSSLSKIQFQTEAKIVTYQLYLGSGNYKKSETGRLHSP
ncbi:competence type IV pilus minor pilin ComGD [Streptococcus sp. zg-JUN1979]|uniref:competence type IV pilus minor pilin ComGD n=1 Tax=Streptococcus sp. zg-JUN1979 TaxID=3391450 RepID=UPI0039A72C03